MPEMNLRTWKRLEDAAKCSFEKVLAALRAQQLDNGRTGGIFRFFSFNSLPGSLDEPDEWLKMKIGTIRPERIYRNEMFSAEKAARIAMRHKGGFPDLSSWITRDVDVPPPGIKRFGGAVTLVIPPRVRADDADPLPGIMSFSGLPEFGDEALCLLTARDMGWWCTFTEIVQLSNNKFAATLLEG